MTTTYPPIQMTTRAGFTISLLQKPTIKRRMSWRDQDLRYIMDSSLLIDQQPLPGIHVDHKNLSPRLLYGETAQGIMTAEFKQAETVVEKFVHRDQSAPQIRLLL